MKELINVLHIIQMIAYYSSRGTVAECIKMSVSQPRGRRLEPYLSQYDSSYDTSTGWLQEADSRMIYLSYENMFHNRSKICLS